MSEHSQPSFPDPTEAGSDGLLMTGGKLQPAWLLAAYRAGIFPMPVDFGSRTILAWFSPDPRGILELDSLHVSRRLARRLRRGEFQFTIDRDFAAVVAGCAAPRGAERETWLTPTLYGAYLTMHRAGVAHSVEVWQNNQLVGGIFGLAIGGLFAGESMFHRATDASKAALCALVAHLKRRGFGLLDVQWTNSHTTSLGAVNIPRAEYLARLRQVVDQPVTFR
jgi:leucyl/phenylalanyl-tRNA--protein transferase